MLQKCVLQCHYYSFLTIMSHIDMKLEIARDKNLELFYMERGINNLFMFKPFIINFGKPNKKILNI